MKIARCIWFVATLVFVVEISTAAQGQHFYRLRSGTTTVITATSPDGWLTWSNATVGGTCTVEHASSLLGFNVWHPLLRRAVTASVMRVHRFAPPDDMVLIPGGTNAGRDPDFGSYSLTVNSFYVDRYEVTESLWDEVKNWNGGNGYSYGNTARGKAANHPVHSVIWYDVVKWCNARSQKEGRTPVYYTDVGLTQVYKAGWVLEPYVKASANGYRLPTEVEWEYAARGGVAYRRFPWGESDEIQHALANYFSSAGYSYDTSPTRQHHPTYNDQVYPCTSPVGSFAPNGYGLYDMAGNICEWCYDWSPGSVGTARVVRGGCWDYYAPYCRVAYRDGHVPGHGNNDIGFRTVLPPGQ